MCNLRHSRLQPNFLPQAQFFSQAQFPPLPDKGQQGFWGVLSASTKRHKIMTKRDKIPTKRHKISTKRHKISSKRHTIPTKRHKISTKRHKISTERHTIPKKRHKISTKRHNIQRDPELFVPLFFYWCYSFYFLLSFPCGALRSSGPTGLSLRGESGVGNSWSPPAPRLVALREAPPPSCVDAGAAVWLVERRLVWDCWQRSEFNDCIDSRVHGFCFQWVIDRFADTDE